MQNRLEQWKQFNNLDPELRRLLDTMSEADLKDAFYTALEFGTAGIRGVIGAGPNRLNIYTIRKANVAFAKYLLQYEDILNKGVAIAYDNRYMSKEFAIESAKVLAMYHIPSYVFTSLRPTPELSFAVRYLGCIGGIVITASHNPKEYNGYKVYDHNGCQLIPNLIDQVIEKLKETPDELRIEVNLDETQNALIHWIDEPIDTAYINQVLKIQLRPNQDKSKAHIVYTPQHGTGYMPVMRVMKEAGYQIIPVTLQCTADPAFSNTITPNPEEKDAYKMAIEMAIQHNAEGLITTDPDADRIGVGVKHHNEYVLLTGNQTAAILIEYLFSTKTQLNLMPYKPVMFNTIVTSDLGEKVAKHYGVETEKTLTGFKFIGSRIEHYQQTKEKTFIFGYEESYGYLFEPFVRDKDAIQASLMLAECMTYYHHLNMTLVDVLNSLYTQYGFHLEQQVSLALKSESGAIKLKEIMHHFRTETIDSFANIKVSIKEDYLLGQRQSGLINTKLEGFPSADVIKYILEDGSWLAIRPSGTEPKCKFYFCILDKSMDLCQKKFEALKLDLEKHYQ
ncbi:MAG: phospho-sugar mutase [Erysipelotrichaceae bacterium]